MKRDRLPSLNSLRAFDAAVRHMSFQKAARELNVTPAALSYQIRQIEEDLGLKLFKRLNRAIELTHYGELIAPGIRDGFDRFNQSIRKLTRQREGDVLVISASPAFAAKWLAPRLYRFLDRNPGVDARVSASLNLVDLDTDDVDVAIRFGKGDYEGCQSVKLLDEYVTPMCNPSFLDGDTPIKKASDLANHTLIHDEAHVGYFELANWRTWLDSAGANEVDSDSSGLHFNVADHALDAAVAGSGIVLGRQVLAQPDLDTGRLVAPFDLKLKADFAFYSINLDERSDEPIISAFNSWLQEEISGETNGVARGPAV